MTGEDRTVQVPVSLIEKALRLTDDPWLVVQYRALLSQPTPTAEPELTLEQRRQRMCPCTLEPVMPTITKGMRVRYRGTPIERIVGDFVDGAWDLIVPGTEKSPMAIEPDGFWSVVELVPEPPQ